MQGYHQTVQVKELTGGVSDLGRCRHYCNRGNSHRGCIHRQRELQRCIRQRAVLGCQNNRITTRRKTCRNIQLLVCIIPCDLVITGSFAHCYRSRTRYGIPTCSGGTVSLRQAHLSWAGDFRGGTIYTEAQIDRYGNPVITRDVKGCFVVLDGEARPFRKSGLRSRLHCGCAARRNGIACQPLADFKRAPLRH